MRREHPKSGQAKPELSVSMLTRSTLASALVFLSLAQPLIAARSMDKEMAFSPTCYPADCQTFYCLGPSKTGVNAPVHPKTTNGDWNVSLSVFYWGATQDGMEYAIKSQVSSPEVPNDGSEIDVLNHIVDATFNTPDFDWDVGFKVELGSCPGCDGWDLGFKWTWYRNSAIDHVEAEPNDNETLILLWSAYAPNQGGSLYASDIESQWKLKLNWIDIALGRHYWVSKHLSMRPFAAIRIGFFDQSLNFLHKGGSFSANANTTPDQLAYRNQVSIENDYKGGGVLSGISTLWNLGCGFALYGDLSGSLLYGRFQFDYNEINRQTQNPHEKRTIAQIKDRFRTSSPIIDLGIGIHYEANFCDSAYVFSVSLGWEQHLFFNQNQMWRINRKNDPFLATLPLFHPNDGGANFFEQSRGDLSTQGWTLSALLTF